MKTDGGTCRFIFIFVFVFVLLYVIVFVLVFGALVDDGLHSGHNRVTHWPPDEDRRGKSLQAGFRNTNTNTSTNTIASTNPNPNTNTIISTNANTLATR